MGRKSTSCGGNDFEENFHEEMGELIVDDIYMPPPPIKPTLNGDQTGKRLVITTIEIENFKSYGGKSVLGPFYKCYNSIVGPNGSGKSNVIDSMLFVFGYRANKIRSSKISSIIHHSETYPNLDWAQVKVNFAMIDDHGGEDFDLMPGSEFSISRVVTKNNTSNYKINNRTVQFKDVSKKLQECGIDLRYNRFLILQGEVEQISLMKPKAEGDKGDVGMLEYLEDIVGTSRYKEPISKLTVKYNESNEMRSHCMNRVQQAQKELKTLKETKSEAVRALELENVKKIEKAKMCQLQMHKLGKKLSGEETEFNAIQARFDELIKAEKEIDTKHKELELEEKTKTTEHDRLRKEASELKEKFNAFQQDDIYLNTKHKSTKEKLKKLKKQNEELRAKLESLQNVPSENDDQIEKLEEKKKAQEEELKEVEEQIKVETEVAQKECAELIKKRDEVDRVLMRFRDEQSGKLKQMNDANNAWMVHKQKAEGARDKFNQLQVKLKKVNEESIEKAKLIERYTEEIPAEKAKLQKHLKRLEELERKDAQLTQSMSTLNEEAQQLKQSANKTQSHDRTRNALMRAQAEGRLQGLHGTLGELGAIDQKYDVAVSTACGRLKNFVVDTIDQAMQCVEFLKENNMSPVTFIALDKIRVGDWTRSGPFPEDVPRLFDLIRINDERIRPAFYFALGDTLVANDITQATRIAYGRTRRRVVTLKGDMIEADGAMSGGGRPRSGGMGSSIAVDPSISQERIAQLEAEVAQLRSKREEIIFEMDNLHREVNNLEKDIQIMSEKLKSCKVDVEQNQSRVVQYQENLKKQEVEMKMLEENPAMGEAEQEYLKAKSIYDKEVAKMDSQQEEKRGYDEEIREKLSSRTDPLKKQKKSLEKKLKETQNQLNQIHSERKSNELNLKKAEEDLAANEEAQVTTQAEIESIKTQIGELEVRATQITTQYEEAKDQLANFESTFLAIQKSVRELQDQVKKIKDEKLDVKHEMEKKYKVVKEKRDKMAVYKRELESIELEPTSDLYSDDEEEEEEEEEVNVKTEDNPARTSGGEELANGEEAMEVDQDVDADDTIVEDNGEQPVGSQSQTEEAPRKKRKKRSEPTIPQLTPEELDELSMEELERNIEVADSERKKITPNFAAIKEYREKRKDYQYKMSELDATTARRDTYMDHLNRTKNQRLEEFKFGFRKIATELKRLYRTITLGGDADLEFIDSLDPFSEGINFAVRPNKKSWKNNINLSGGEKTLASLALIFALHYYKPSPLYIMDEIDAALDFKNVSIIANYIKERTRNTQFLIISLRNNMYELADRLIGIYKTYQVTKSIPFDPKAFEAQAPSRCSSQADTFKSYNFNSQSTVALTSQTTTMKLEPSHSSQQMMS